ncbi:MAG: squalene/phytoene synthase family protein, partial [Acidobacteriota bacterium]
TIAYLLFRIADTFEDAAGWPKTRRLEALESFSALVAGCERAAAESDAGARRAVRDEARKLAGSWTAGEPPVGHAGYLDLLAASPDVLDAFAGLPPEARRAVARHTRRTADGMTGFVARHDGNGRLQLEDLDDLRHYCYVVAGIVGEMLTELFLLAEPGLAPRADALTRRAARFGEALQLVNILKDAAADAREGRRYLPDGVEPATVFGLAREDLLVATEYVRTLQQGGASRGLLEFTALPVQLAWGTLERVESEGPGAKLTRKEVRGMVAELGRRLEHGEPALRVPGGVTAG